MESDLDLEKKMKKLKFLGWGGVGGIRFGVGKKNEKVEIFGVGGLVESDLDLGRQMTKLKFMGWGGWQNQIWTWEKK